MKIFRKPIANNFSGIALAAVSAMFLLSACASKMAFKTSDVVPAAEGYVKVKQDDNKNYNIDLQVNRLAEAERLSPAKSTYVVWLKTDEDPAKNIGQLNTSSSLFSNTLKSSLQTTSTNKPTGFFITAENDGGTDSPGDMIVLKTE